MLKGEYIICMSSIDWDFIWQGHQQVMASLAANGNRVLFISSNELNLKIAELKSFARHQHSAHSHFRSCRRRWWRTAHAVPKRQVSEQQ